MSFKIVRNDITKMETEAIVNTANSDCSVGAGCDIAVYNAAGYDELLKFRIENIGMASEGEAFITPSFNLKSKYIIHVVSPLYIDGESGEEDKLRDCYRNGLRLAKENDVKSISFPLVSTGSFGYPREEGIRIALDEINGFLIDNDMEIYLVVFDGKSTELGERVYPDLRSYIDSHYVETHRVDEYGGAVYSSSLSPVRPGDIDYPEYGRRYDVEDRLARRPKPRRFDGAENASASVMLGAASQPQMNMAPMAQEVPKASKPKPSFSIFKNSKKEKAKSEQAYLAAECEAEALMPLNAKLEERMGHLEDTFSQYLLYLIQEKGLTNVDVYKRSILCDKKTFSKIKNNINYHPDKRTALCLCVGARLNLDEAVDLLARAGYAFSPCDKQDVIFSYFLEKSPDEYDMVDVDIELENYELPCIIA